MMGKKKLATIKAELRKAFKAEGVDQDWFSRQIRKLERQAKPNPTELETLVMMRDLLADAAPSVIRKRVGRSRVRSN